jgi:hypothetical protein
MIARTSYLHPQEFGRALPDTALDSPSTLVLVFSGLSISDMTAPVAQLRKAFPRSVLLGCSTAGEVHGPTVRDQGVSVTVARFDRTRLHPAQVSCPDPARSAHAGGELADRFSSFDLRGVLLLSDGLTVNGTELLERFTDGLNNDAVVFGGLAADHTDFRRTWVLTRQGLSTGTVAALGLSGDRLVLEHGSEGGWEDFGPERVISRADRNVLTELDGRNALDLYTEYLGDLSADLPGSGLYFPLEIRPPDGGDRLVRTLLGVDHRERTLTFAGNVPQGWSARFMRADLDRLVDGAQRAAACCRRPRSPEDDGDRLGIAISCVGRRLVLKERSDEELEAVHDALGPETDLIGFYSYGEISPRGTRAGELHNQTMTVSTVSERT